MLMRSYILTDRERTVLQNWFNGKKVGSVEIAKLRFRFKKFRITLESDLRLLKRLAES